MKVLTNWLRHYLPSLSVSDRELADDLTLRGIAVEGVHSLGDGNGHLFEMDITTNRVDAMNHYGIAREAATIYNLPLAPVDASLAANGSEKAFPVRIEAPELCGRFTAQVLRGVTIAPSAGRIAEYFNLLEQKQISNAVDASNYTLVGMGHPTHAFDLDKLEGGIVVRLARKGERLKLLDGTERVLEADDLVVADEKKALALAGVMGGWDSMITAETKNILVEAAWFDPATVRRSSRRHGLHTDASHRFERGADFNAAPVANRLVSALILESGGAAEGAMVDVVVPEAQARTAARPPVKLSVKQVQRHLGKTIDAAGIGREIVAQYLTALGCTLAAQGDDAFSVALPSWRLDLEREIDLIEEVARVYGYNRFANTLPAPLPVVAHPLAAKEAAVRARLLALGFSESVSSTFASHGDAESFGDAGKGAIALENPLSEEVGLLRPSLVPGMVAMLANNLNRDVREARLFEQGQIFTGSTEAVVETAQLTLGLTTAGAGGVKLYATEDVPFFEMKGAMESVLSLFAMGAVAFVAEGPKWLEAGRAASVVVDGQAIACFGELAGEEASRLKLRQPVYLAQVDLARLYAFQLRRAMARELSRFQAVERDFSFTFPDAVRWLDVAGALGVLGIAELQSFRPVEDWRDRKKYPGVHSMLVRVVFQSLERTLRDEELAAWSARIIEALTGLGGTLRA
ncbi:phenylalanine--tRNA ligase beta subunit [Edaphobacter acidisoli]|uniref:Phenylalanine--tRNA ligase beta subunit n=1 Tax=Edaphobacter acidisoli TaxID=2040573 RepID=A0A916RU27_9BACT|nr:phenylalanine--tRNA ligase subunit beta [Edaphobacter acidisoli]GGA67570.1 phenylalanine--tRNA ligase beta subunit [Edaphobacter acidisoli]